MLRIETRRSVALLLSPLILLAAWWMAYNGMYGTMYEASWTGVYIWEETSSTLKDSVLQIGPLVAGLSAWAAGRNRRRGMDDLLSTTARPSASRDLATWAGAALPAVAVYLLLAVLLGVPTALEATWGAPLPGYFLVGLVALLMDSALGLAAGYYLPGRFTAPLAAVALYIAHLLPMGMVDLGINYTFLSPAAYSNLTGADVFSEPARLAIQQLLLFGGLCGVALCAVALKGGGARKTARIALAASGAVSAAGFATALSTEDLYVFPGSGDYPKAVAYEPVCREGGITVCVHPAYEKLLPETARAVNEVAEPLVGIPAVPKYAVQSSPAPGAATGGFDPDEAVFFGYAGKLAMDEVADGIVDSNLYDHPGHEDLQPTQEDLRRCGKFPRKYLHPDVEAQTVVGGWLRMRAGGSRSVYTGECPNADKLVDRFAALGPTERRAWLEKNFAGLRAGKVTLKDLP